MGRPTRGNDRRRRRLVGIGTESFSSFGRSVIRGVLRYANLQRNWEIYRDVLQVTGGADWPECDGSVTAGLPQAVFDNIRRRSRHVVSCSGFADPEQSPVVSLDDEAAGAMAATHLLEVGAKSFAFYGPTHGRNDAGVLDAARSPFSRRERGFRRTLERYGCPCTSFDPLSPDYTELLTHAHHARAIAWLRSLPKPVGILAGDDTFASDLANACQKADLFVPEHIAIVGVNNDELLCESAWPMLTSVECGFDRMGFLAAQTLDRLMRGETVGVADRGSVLPPVRIHQRDSTQRIVANQPAMAEALRFIREHACDPCTADDVTRAVVVSRRTLERRFAAALGRSVSGEIARARIDVAERLLSRSSLSTDEVAGRCGFTTVQGFTRFFRDNSGVTPAVFRRRSRPEPRPSALASRPRSWHDALKILASDVGGGGERPRDHPRRR